MLDAGLATLDLLKRLLRRFLKVESGRETPEYTPIALVYTGLAGAGSSHQHRRSQGLKSGDRLDRQLSPEPGCSGQRSRLAG